MANSEKISPVPVAADHVGFMAGDQRYAWMSLGVPIHLLSSTPFPPLLNTGCQPLHTKSAIICPLTPIFRAVPYKSYKGSWRVFEHPPVKAECCGSIGTCIGLLVGRDTSGFSSQGRYRNIYLGLDEHGSKVTISAHRLVCGIVHGKPSRMSNVVCHAVKGCYKSLACVHPLHLRWDTPKANRADCNLVKVLSADRRKANLLSRFDKCVD